MGEDRSFALILTAAGSSTRLAMGCKKEFLTLEGVPVLRRAFLPFLESGLFSRFVVTYPAGLKAETEAALGSGIPGVIFVEGGEARQASVFRALNALSQYAPDYVLIHDGARPWVTRATVVSVAEETVRSGAAAPFVQSVDALKGIDTDGTISRHFVKGEVVCIQTPQGFRFQAILDAHRKARAEGVSSLDDTELYSRYEGRVQTVAGSPENRKITYSFDLGDV